MESNLYYYNVLIISDLGERLNLVVQQGTKIGEIINEYFKRIRKTNLLVKNFDNVTFLLDDRNLKNYFNESLERLFGYRTVYSIKAFNGYYNDRNYKIIETIKENVFSSVFKAEYRNGFVAIKKIYKDKIKEEMKFNLCKEEITEEEFKPELLKFNKEIEYMQKCHCQNSVKIYNYFVEDNELIIIMELCDETLFHLLCRKPKGFNSEEIKNILLQLNNVFKRMNFYKISHRDIKLNNILIKYLNKEKTKYNVLLSDYGISNQLYSLTGKFNTHAGSQVIMAPEILNDEDYSDKCDLWSLGVIIYQLYTKNFPYKGTVEKAILKQIETEGLKVLDKINEKDKKLKNLLSHLLVRNPKHRYSWEEYYKDPFLCNYLNLLFYLIIDDLYYLIKIL